MNTSFTTSSAHGEEIQRLMRDMNEALMISAVREHEMAEEARLAYTAVRTSEERFRFLAENVPEKIFIADATGSVTYLNPQWTAYTGLVFEQLQGWGWMLSVHPQDVDENVRLWRHSVDTGDSFRFERRLRRADGQYRWHVTTAAAMRNGVGQISMWVGSSGDVDDARRADEAMRVRLEAEVKQRTSELLSANEQLQGFTYSVAHDLRQQIRGISSNAAILIMDLGDELDVESNHSLVRLVDSSKRLSKLVDDLLAYARLGREEPNKEPFDLTALAAEVASFLAEGRRCRLGTRFKIARGLAAKGDVVLIRTVIQNLLENACKYSMETENPVIEVGRKGDGFFVRDNGIGFDMRYVGKLFQPFERLHSDSIYPGTGIGLANVRRIIEKHGGKVWAEGKPGEGSTFFFTLK